MKKAILSLMGSLLVVLGAAGSVNSQTLNRVELRNLNRQSVYVIAYDPSCRIRVFEGVLIDGGSIIVRVCAGDRGLGRLVLYDVYGRGFEYSKLHDGSRVNIRFR
jgi:hypothetical protein